MNLRKFKLLLFVYVVLILTSNNIAAQVTGTNNTLGATGITAIQSTTNTNYKLTVGGAVKIFNTGNSGLNSASLYLINTSASGKKYFLNSDNAGSFRIMDSSVTIPRFIINTSGNIGIGTATANNKLEIDNTTANTSGLRFTRLTSSSTVSALNGKKLSVNATGDVILTNDSLSITQTANRILAGPATGAAGLPTFRALVAADIPVLSTSKINFTNSARLLGRYSTGTGVAEEISVGTGLTLSSTGVLSAAGGGGSGTVTSFGFTNGNGFSGTVATPTVTPTLTLGTSLNGLLRGNGTGLTTGQANLATEVSGILPLTNGGTGLNTIGTNGQVLTVNGGVPTWANPTVSPNYWTATGNNISNDNIGNVGIGITNPATKLDVSGGITSTGGLLLKNAAAVQFWSATNDNYGSLNAFESGGFQFTTGAGNKISILNSGNVGIATAGITPDALLHVLGNNNLQAGTRYLKTHIGGAAYWANEAYEELGVGFSGIRSVYNVNNNKWDLAFATGYSTDFINGTQTEKIRINGSNGNLGIGTSYPDEKLDVSGNIKFSGALMPNNIAGTAGQVLTSAGTGAAPIWATPSPGGSTGWALTGNAGTNPATNFIGTTDNVDLVFKRNNVKSGFISADNAALGVNSLAINTTGSRNVALGLNSLAVNTSGNYNVAVGALTLTANTSGFNNLAVGDGALTANTTGHTNVATGSYALLSNTTGISNTASGNQALSSNTTGNYNVATGRGALQFSTTGSDNVATGLQSMYSNSTGFNNVASGSYSLHSNTTGNTNTAIGYNTGRGITTGSNNTIIGANVQGLAPGLSNNIIIADGQGNRRINVDANGNVGIGTTTTTDLNYKLFVETGIRTRKVKVDQVAWPDYVFDKKYPLLPLQDLEKFLQQNKHLPGVPSANEVHKNGIDLGDNQSMLLKKVEELTLYMIEINKKVEALSKENEELKKKVSAKEK